MRWDLPGKVMIIDNRFSTIEKLADKLTKKGIPVLFWNGRGKPPHSASGVRIVLLDLDFTDSGEGFDYYDDTARILGLLSGPYAVLIYSVNATEDSPERIEQAYSDVHHGRQIPGFVIRPPVYKQEDAEVKDIMKPIRSSLDNHPVLDSILLAEQSLEYSKDSSLAELAQKRFDPSFRTLVKSIAGDSGCESVARELLTCLLRFHTRHIEKTRIYPMLKTRLMTLLTQKIPGGNASCHERIMHLRTYYKPDPKETSWTGDIYRTRFKDGSRRYAILITPACDISKRKAHHLTFCYGFAITRDDIENNPNCVIYALDDRVKSKVEAIKYLGWKGIPDRFYPVDNFVEDNNTENTIRVIFNFQAIESIRSEKFRRMRWRRLWRLDSPYIEDLLQRFGSHSFRIGTPNRLKA